jgi:hypothetical protein
MHPCTCVSEEGDNGEDPDSEAPSLMSYTLIRSRSVLFMLFLFYYESRKRELKTRLIYEDRCDERLKN